MNADRLLAAQAMQKAQCLHITAPREVPRLGDVVLNIGVEQIDRDFLRVVAEALQMDIRMLARRAVEHRAGQIRIVGLQALHPFERGLAHAAQHGGLAVALENRLIFADFLFDLIVVGQKLAADLAFAHHEPRCLALGGGVVETVFGDHSRGRDRDFLAHALRIDM